MTALCVVDLKVDGVPKGYDLVDFTVWPRIRVKVVTRVMAKFWHEAEQGGIRIT